jgi:hypothetical protein
MGEALANHGGIFGGGDDLQDAATVGTLLDVDIEHPDAAGPNRCGWKPVDGEHHDAHLKRYRR